MQERLQRVFVIGVGEVGGRLTAALRRSDVQVDEVTREQGWPEASSDTEDLRLVCVREEQLASVLERLRKVPDTAIAAIQNGWIRPVLNGRTGITRGLIWFTSKGDFFRVLRPSPFHGPSAEPLAEALAAGELSAVSVGDRRFRELEADKMGFNCVVGLPLAVHRLSLGEYLERLPDEARTLFEESVSTCARALGAIVSSQWWDAFTASIEPLAWVRSTKAKALEFRNGAIAALAADHGTTVPVTERLLAIARRRQD